MSRRARRHDDFALALDERQRKLMAVGGIATAAVISALLLATPKVLRAARARSLPIVPSIRPEFVALADKWARAYNVPLQWVLATILSESNGNPNTVGDYHVDPQGASIGLMQVNAVAHGDELARAGLTRESLFNPDINIQWGTMILAKCIQSARNRGGGDVGLLARLCYTGAVRSGTDTSSCSSCPNTAMRWRENLNRTSAAA